MTVKQTWIDRFHNWMRLKNYAAKTIKCYDCSLRQFWDYCEKRKHDPDFSKVRAVEIYLLERMDAGRKWQTINGDYSAMRLFYVNILNREWDEKHLPRPRKERSLPKVVSRQNIQKLLEHAVCFKHKVFFALLYSTGLRLGEALRLRIEDIDAGSMQIRVLDGKGKKDRFTLLSGEMLELLRLYYTKVRPAGGLLFNGRTSGNPWSEKAAQYAFVGARRAGRLPEYITAHTLRHSFASHSLEDGTDLVTLQHLLGHKYIKTTVRYIHLDVAHFKRISNPADSVIAWEQLTNLEKSSANSATNSFRNTEPVQPYVNS
ncbi:MAG: tyrosine-type recombinase/integrase [Bacteroidetes bacterium]|nr:tyrosine-type recombinase/integrase [Bacteroidota bacterium]